jgi:hypothetical protein
MGGHVAAFPKCNQLEQLGCQSHQKLQFFVLLVGVVSIG